MKAKKITKKVAEKFVEAVKQGLLEMGAELQPETRFNKDRLFEFKLDTIVGNMNISLYLEQDNLFCVFARFDDVAKAKEKFNCNPFSGKCNFHKVYYGDLEECIDMALDHFECTLPLEKA